MPDTALSVDLAGLRQLVERRGKAFALMELVQNAWDEPGVTFVTVSAKPVAGQPRATISITDDSPNGFQHLHHAYTLFAPSKKKDNPLQRGRFNLGEKMVIALSDEFSVETMKGGVVIDVPNNTRRNLRKRRDSGSQISAVLRMTHGELEDALVQFRTLIPPTGIRTFLNDKPLPHRLPLGTFEATLQTEISDDEGFLRPTKRKAMVEIYDPLPGETPSLYEMGIPVVETDDTFHVNVMQKVPLNADRDNVPPAFLRDVRALVLNEMASRLSKEDAQSNWVNEAIEDELIDSRAVETILTKRFGEKRVVFDPSDPEANRIAMSKGYQVIPPRTFSTTGWDRIREFKAVQPAGQVTPSPKPFAANGRPLERVDPKDMAEHEKVFVRAVQRLHKDLIGDSITCVLTKDRQWRGFDAVYGGGEVIIKIYADQPADITHEHTLATVIHEFAHFFGDHLTHTFDFGMGLIAARLARKMIADPSYFTKLTKK